MFCPLCRSSQTNLFYEDKLRSFHKCSNCFLIFVPEIFHDTFDVERTRYDQHQNSPSSLRFSSYQDWMLEFLDWSFQWKVEGEILDFGSGPYPLLQKLLLERGKSCHCFDKHYAHNENILLQKYDVIYSSEVVEHFRGPHENWKQLVSLLKTDGSLFIRTSPWNETIDFKNWHYMRDLTHLSFYHQKSFNFIEKEFGLVLKKTQADMFYFEKRVLL